MIGGHSQIYTHPEPHLISPIAHLGYYDNIFFQSIHGKPLGCSMIKSGYHGSAHFDPLLVLLCAAIVGQQQVARWLSARR